MTTLVWDYEAPVARRVGTLAAGRDLAILAAVFVLQVPLILNADLGWLLTVCEKMLAGGKLGVDVLELNPPLSVLMYMPAAYLGSILPVPAHVFVIAMVLMLAWVSMQVTVAALAPCIDSDPARRRARLSLLLVLTLAPIATFGQREHIAMLAMVPFVAFAARLALAEPRHASLKFRLLIGLFGGFAMCIKPHFALCAGLPLLWAAVRTRSVRPLFNIACWTAAAVVVLYFGTALIAYPLYFSLYPRWAALAYLPLRLPVEMLLSVGFWCSLAGLAWMLGLICGRDRSAWMQTVPWLLAAGGGFLSYYLQGKGFAYTRLPAAIFALLAALLTPAFLNGVVRRDVLPKVVLAALPIVLWLVPASNSFAALQEPIRSVAPPHPKMLAISSNVGLGEPLVRNLDGEWASAAGSQLLSGGALVRLEEEGLAPADRVLAKQIIAMERDRLRGDLQKRQPDVLLVGRERFGVPFNWEAWAREDPAISQELDRNYRFLMRRAGVAIWIRRRT